MRLLIWASPFSFYLSDFIHLMSCNLTRRNCNFPDRITRHFLKSDSITENHQQNLHNRPGQHRVHSIQRTCHGNFCFSKSHKSFQYFFLTVLVQSFRISSEENNSKDRNWFQFTGVYETVAQALGRRFFGFANFVFRYIIFVRHA